MLMMVTCRDSSNTGVIKGGCGCEPDMPQPGLVNQSRVFVAGIAAPVVTKLLLEVDFDRQPVPRSAGGQGNSPVTFRYFSNLECGISTDRRVADADGVADRLGAVMPEI